ncbi:MAG: hypothetical protein ABUS57_02070 [Pseudomonadota bacterium]
MHFSRYAAPAFAAAALIATPAMAQTAAPSAADIAAMRRDLENLRHDYDARIAALEARLAQAEAASGGQSTTQTAQAPAAPADQTAAATPPADQVVIPDQVTTDQSTVTAEAAPPPAAPAAPTAMNAYNPGIAAVLNGFYTAASKDTQGARIAGFATGDEIDRPARGFSLGESELSFTANIDPSLAGFMDFSIDSANQVSLEEAYIRSTALPGGFTIKAGRFLSGIGYLNERHAHDWTFSDAPLPYRALLNTQLGDDGVQVRWLAPTDMYLEFGAEALRGEAYPASGADHRGVGTYTAFVKTGSDINASSSWLGGLSYLHTSAVDRTDSSGDLFNGHSDLGIASAVYKWAPNGNPTTHNLVVTGEYFYGRDQGTFNGVALDQTHQGWYVQGVYQFMPQWSAGLRFSGLNSDDPGPLLAGTELDDMGHSPFDATALLEFDTSEFGRLRLQYTHDEAGPEANDIAMLQYTVIYGPHGAHRY